MLAIHERAIRNHRAEQVIRFVKEGVTPIRRKRDLLGRIVRIPGKLVDIWTKIQMLQAEAGRLLMLLDRFKLFFDVFIG